MSRYARILGCMTLLAALSAGAGCNRYEARIVVDENGGGTRTSVMRLKPDPEDGTIAIDDLARLAGMDAGHGWHIAAEADRARMEAKEGEYIYKMTSSAAGIEDWHRMDGSITVRATLGPSRYESVLFENEVSVELGAVTNGKTYTYRERFHWHGLVDVIIRFESELFARRMKRDYPYLDETSVSELRGIMAGQLAVAFENLRLWQDDGIDERTIAASVGEQAAEVVRRAGRKADLTHVYDVAASCLDDDDEEFEQFVADNLPGVLYVGATTIELTLVLPGRVTQTNGSVREDGAVRWKMELLDAFSEPIEFYARSELLP